jgi:cupin 2 domain-containing protein
MAGPVRGTLFLPADAPDRGERAEHLVRLGGVEVAQIASGTLGTPVDYDQAYDEWAAVLCGGAVLEVAGERIDLAAGEWVFLPAHLPHRLLETRPGTTWLTVSAAGGE